MLYFGILHWNTFSATRMLLRLLGCWIPYPGGTPCARACFFHGVIGLPQRKMGRLPAVIPLETTSCEGGFSRLQIFRYVPASKFARPQIVLTAANTPAGQPGLLRPSRTRFVTSPRIGYANRPKTGNWRCGDLHPARLRPCRLLLSILPPKIPDGGFSPVRLQSWPIRQCLPNTPSRLSHTPGIPLIDIGLHLPFVRAAAHFGYPL